MNTLAVEKLASFVDTLGVSSLGSPLNEYELQRELVALCREKRLPFFASMPVRSRFHCKACGLESTQVKIQFEDPARASSNSIEIFMWGEPSGLFFLIDQSELHQIIVHDAPVPPGLLELVNRVGT